jgi:hypothetical protein
MKNQKDESEVKFDIIQLDDQGIYKVVQLAQHGSDQQEDATCWIQQGEAF